MAANTVITSTIKVTADTGAAKKDMQSLMTEVSKLANQIVLKTDTTELKYGVQSAKDLKTALEAAVNVDTGKLNLNSFARSLKQSKTSLTEIGNNMAVMGSKGTAAFDQLSTAIASASAQTL